LLKHDNNDKAVKLLLEIIVKGDWKSKTRCDVF
jgi:hypothetical protein